MFVRTVALLALLVGIQAAPSATTSARKTVPIVRVAYRVEYRPTGQTAWKFKGTYRAADTARVELNALYDAGHDARMIRFETVTMLRSSASVPPSPAPPALSGGISVVSYSQAMQAFRAGLVSRWSCAAVFVASAAYALALGLLMYRIILHIWVR